MLTAEKHPNYAVVELCGKFLKARSSGLVSIFNVYQKNKHTTETIY